MSTAGLRRRRHIGARAQALLRSAQSAGGWQRRCRGCQHQAGGFERLRGGNDALLAAVAGLAAVGAVLEVNGAAHLPLQAGRKPTGAVRLGTEAGKAYETCPCAGHGPGRASATAGRAWSFVRHSGVSAAPSACQAMSLGHDTEAYPLTQLI